MATQPVSAADMGSHAVGTEFNQKVSDDEQEQFMMHQDIYDPTINEQYLEVYMHYAAIERERETNDPRPIPDSPWTTLFKKLTGQGHKIIWADDQGPPPLPPSVMESQHAGDYNEKSDPTTDAQAAGIISNEESERAYRALRVASWQAVFYLITTDILGFSSAPEAFNELGYGPGVLVYTCFYLLAVFAGQIIWRLYLTMDSSKYPVKCYADLGERTFGRAVRHIFNFFQSFQLLFNVALLIVGNGQTLVAIIHYKFCYLALNIFFMLVGVLGGQIRSLRNFAWFANINIWLNIAVMIMTMVGIEKYMPVPNLTEHKDLSQPIKTWPWVPNTGENWYVQVSGVQLAVFAYGGAMIFPEFMAEMRRPRDFWKSALCAQLFCYLIYMMFGLVCYSRQGQYTYILPGINFANNTLILINNIIGLVTTMVAAVLYGNIGVKVFYENVLRAYCRAPSMFSNRGRFYWSATVTGYWVLAWVIGSAIPNLVALVTLVGAACILQFTYTFPPILLLGHWMQCDAMKADHPWSPGMTPGSTRIDTWRDKSRWVRGFRNYWYAKLVLVLLFFAAWANCALGIYAGIETAISAYKEGYNVPFSCFSPGDPRKVPASAS